MSFLRSTPGEDPVEVSGFFRASPARLFAAWTTPSELQQWFGSAPNTVRAAEVDLRVGGRWCCVFKGGEEGAEDPQTQLEGEYLQIEPDSKLVFSWSFVELFADGRREATPESRVTVEFNAVGERTRIDLRHEAIRTEDARLGVGRGWGASFASLQALLAPEEQELRDDGENRVPGRMA